MYNVKSVDELHARVAVLHQEQAEQYNRLKNRIGDAYEKFKPVNILRNAFEELTDNIQPESDLLEEGATIVAGIMVNSLMGKSKNKPLKKWLKIIAVYALTYVVTTYREDIIAAGQKVVNYVSEKMKKGKKEEEDAVKEEEASG